MLSFSYIYDFETGADSITIIFMSLAFVMALCNLYWLCSGTAYLSVVHGFHCLRPQSYRPRNQLAILWKPPVTRKKKIIISKRSVSDCWSLVAGWNLSGDIPTTSLWLLWLLKLTVLCMEICQFVCKHLSLAIQANSEHWKSDSNHLQRTFTCKVFGNLVLPTNTHFLCDQFHTNNC